MVIREGILESGEEMEFWVAWDRGVCGIRRDPAQPRIPTFRRARVSPTSGRLLDGLMRSRHWQGAQRHREVRPGRGSPSGYDAPKKSGVRATRARRAARVQAQPQLALLAGVNFGQAGTHEGLVSFLF